jgi:hypothetical protein
MGIVPGRNGAEAATLRFSVNDRPVRILPPMLVGKSASPRPPVAVRRDVLQLRAALRRELSRVENEVALAKRAVSEATREPLMVTDHAVIRFLERVMSMDVNAIRAQIARIVPPDVLEHDRAIYVRQGVAYLVSTGSIVTVLDQSLDNDLAIAFSIDGVTPAAEFDQPSERAVRKNVRRAAKLLSNRAHDPARRAKAAMTDRLRAERDAGWPGAAVTR